MVDKTITRATHLEHVIVAGGMKSRQGTQIRDDIEALNWMKNSHWKRVTVSLPVPMYGFFPLIADNYLYIVGFDSPEIKPNKSVLKIAVKTITGSVGQKKLNSTPMWITLPEATHWATAIVPNTSPPV